MSSCSPPRPARSTNPALIMEIAATGTRIWRKFRSGPKWRSALSRTTCAPTPSKYSTRSTGSAVPSPTTRSKGVPSPGSRDRASLANPRSVQHANQEAWYSFRFSAIAKTETERLERRAASKKATTAKTREKERTRMNHSAEIMHFDEDRLPPGQPTILTSSLEQFQLFTEMIMLSKEKTGYSSMGVVTGLSGVGKTIAIQTFLNCLESRPHTGLPAGIEIKVTPGSTPRQLMENLLKRLGEKPRGHTTNRYKIADEASEVILNNDLKILFVDEADLLNVDGFEFLRYIFNKTG